MKANFKRFLSLALALVMVLSWVPSSVFAEGSEGEENQCQHENAQVETVEPTCGEAGSVTTTCECGYENVETLEATGKHIYEDGFCTGCGAAEPTGEPESQNENTVVIPNQPTATVSGASKDGSTFAVHFAANGMDEDQQNYYGSWLVDFVLKVNKPLTMNGANPSENSYMSVLCPELGMVEWNDLPGTEVTLGVNESWGALAYLSGFIGDAAKVPYAAFAGTNGMDYAAIFQESYLQANPGLIATVSLVLTNPETSETITVAEHTYTSPYKIPDLPTATITDIPVDKLDPDVPLTFAKSFTAEPPDEAQAAYYGNWYADFVLTVNTDVTFNSDGTADGYLAGEYGEWGWLKVPPEDVTLHAGESLKIMEYAAELKGETGLQYTYNEVLEGVKNFNCGAYFTPEFLEKNPNFAVTLSLQLYETKTATTGKTIGTPFTFTAEDALPPALPTATVTDTLQSELNEGMTLTFAKTFTADEPDDDQAEFYGKYYADFVLKVNKDVTFNADGTADGFLSGQYDGWEIDGFNSENWINVPFNEVSLQAGDELRIMQYAAQVLGQPGLKMTYEEIVENVGTFNCGAYFTPEFLAENPDFEVTLELRLYDPANEEISYVVGNTQEFAAADVPTLPTATVSDAINKKMTFAKNFTADDITAAQYAYYGDWYADFVLTVNQEVTFDANGTADGWLSGQYDGWEVEGSDLDSTQWINVPFAPVTLEAGKPLKIMEYAAELMGEPGLKYTYKEVYDFVKSFNCGVFFDPEFLMGLKEDLVVTLDLRMYDRDDENKYAVIGQTQEFTIPVAPARPTATVTDAKNDQLTFAKNFKVDEITDKQLAYYGSWYADFELTINKPVTFNANDTADGWLSGQYDGWEVEGFPFDSTQWLNVPFEDVTLNANETVKIMEYAAELMGEPGLKYTYAEVYNYVKDFNCGVFFAPEFLIANPDLVVTLELKMYHPQDESVNYVIGDTYIFKNDFVAYNTTTEKFYNDVTVATMDAVDGHTVILLKDVETFNMVVPEGITLDLNGHKLTTGYASSFGNIVDRSENMAGLLAVPAKRILFQKDNIMLPVRTAEGYKFAEVTPFKVGFDKNGIFHAQPWFDTNAHDLLKAGADTTNVHVKVIVGWDQTDGRRTQEFVYNDTLVTEYINKYDSENNKYTKDFILSLRGAEGLENLTFTAVVESETGVKIVSETKNK